MKKLILLVAFLVIPQITHAVDIEYSGDDFKKECFQYKGRYYSLSTDDYYISYNGEDSFLLVSEQNNQLLLNKRTKFQNNKVVKYEISDLQGSNISKDDFINAIIDNNSATFGPFAAYGQKQKVLTIDLGRSYNANITSTILTYSGSYSKQVFIGEDGENFREVVSPDNFQHRYIKYVFTPTSDALRDNLKINDVSISEKNASEYLVKSSEVGWVTVYSGFKCKEVDKYNLAVKQVNDASMMETYSTNSSTNNYPVLLFDNSYYNKDFDNDGVENDIDNCPFDSNFDQRDSDLDQIGDACDLLADTQNANDTDRDNDRVADSVDNCPSIYNPKQQDSNADKIGDLCADDDRDGVIGHQDNCINIANPSQIDVNVNGVGDDCEFDKDGDGVFDSIDNCINTANADQKDSDKDEIGDLCDNCDEYNPRQRDLNHNNVGDVCEEKEEFEQINDKDKDGILDRRDNCRDVANPEQEDKDRDNIGDVCDNCPDIMNRDQVDEDKNGVGDFCEDIDQDGFLGYLDNCPSIKNEDQSDKDNDSVGDVCEDEDRDLIPASIDNCPLKYNKDQSDIDNDGVGDVCDTTDNRFIEENKGVFIALISVVSLFFVILIASMIKKISDDNKQEEAQKLDVEFEENDDKKEY